MSNDLNKKVLVKIASLIPENIKPVNFFMDVLDLGKESAYRRLRGEKALSFEDIYKMSLKLGFSLDELIESNKTDTPKFHDIGGHKQSPENNIWEFFLYYEKYLQRYSKAGNSEIVCTMNHILNTLLVGYDDLFKFVYYRWMHQMKDVPLNYLYSDLVIPAEVKELCSRLAVMHRGIKKVSFIVDNNLFLNLVKEMQYFYIRGLLKEPELNALKEQYLSYMDHLERATTKGVDNNGTKIEIYLSMFSINSTTAYSTWDENEESAFWHYYGHPIITRNKEIACRHKDWLQSLKKYSTVISQSNELLQADFYNKQRSYVDNITKNIRHLYTT